MSENAPDSLRTQVQGISTTLVNIKAMVELLGGEYPVEVSDDTRSTHGSIDELAYMIANVRDQTNEVSRCIDTLLEKI